MMADDFTRRALSFQFVLGKGQFGANDAGFGSNSNVVTLTGLRATALISMPGGATKPTADIKVFGMSPTLMNRLSTLGSIPTSHRINSVAVQAGNVDGTLSTVFTGTIYNGYGDYDQQPNVPFVVNASSAFIEAIKPSPVNSFVGSSDVATMLSGLAIEMGLSFENFGVTAQLSNSYYYGSAWQQAKQIVRDAGIEWNVCEGGVLAIWMPGQSRDTPTPPEISPDTGMIGYPSFFPLGLQLRTVFNPLIVFGRRITVKSSLPNSSGPWVVAGLQHSLESRTPDGAWETSVQATPVGYGVVVPSLR